MRRVSRAGCCRLTTGWDEPSGCKRPRRQRPRAQNQASSQTKRIRFKREGSTRNRGIAEKAGALEVQSGFTHFPLVLFLSTPLLLVLDHFVSVRLSVVSADRSARLCTSPPQRDRHCTALHTRTRRPEEQREGGNSESGVGGARWCAHSRCIRAHHLSDALLAGSLPSSASAPFSLIAARPPHTRMVVGRHVVV